MNPNVLVKDCRYKVVSVIPPESPSKFYVLQESDVKILSTLRCDLAEHFNKKNPIELTEDDIVVGTVCVLYTDIWRRVKVEYAIDLDFGLRDVDTGEFLTNVPLSSLHKLVSPFNMHKFLAIPCRLDGVYCGEESLVWSRRCLGYFKSLLKVGKVIEAECTGYTAGLCNLKVFGKNNTNVADILLNLGLVASFHESQLSAENSVLDLIKGKLQQDSYPQLNNTECKVEGNKGVNENVKITQEMVVVNQINSPNEFWVMLLKSASYIEKLESIMAEAFGSSSKPVNKDSDWMQEGNYYGVQITPGVWKRGCLLEYHNTHPLIFCVDYGYKKKFSLSSIRPLPEMFIKALPFQAIPCSLCIDSVLFTKQVLSYFENLLESQEAHEATFLGRLFCGSYQVVLGNKVKEKLDKFIRSDFCNQNGPIKASLQDILRSIAKNGQFINGYTAKAFDQEVKTKNKEVSEVSQISKKTSSTSTFKAKKALGIEENNEILCQRDSVIVTHASSLSKFYVSHVSNKSSFMKMTNAINIFMDGTSDKIRDVITVDSFVLALRNGVWSRAKVIKIMPKNSFFVFFVDFGNKDSVHDCVLMPPKLMSWMPMNCIPCRLLADVSQTSQNNGYLLKKIQNSCMVIVDAVLEKDAIYSIDFRCESDKLSIVQLLAKNNSNSQQPSKYTLFSQQSSTENNNNSRNSDDAVDDKLEDYKESNFHVSRPNSNITSNHCKKDHGVKVGDRILIVYVEAFDSFFLHVDDIWSKSMDLMNRALQKFCHKTKVPSKAPSEGSKVAGLFEDEWARAVVLPSSSVDIKVKFIDYGNVAEVKLHDIRVLDSDLSELPPTPALSCQLKNFTYINSRLKEVENENFNRKKLNEWFKNTFELKSFKLDSLEKVFSKKIINPADNDSFEVGLYCLENKKTVEDLVEEFFEHEIAAKRKRNLSVQKSNGKASSLQGDFPHTGSRSGCSKSSNVDADDWDSDEEINDKNNEGKISTKISSDNNSLNNRQDSYKRSYDEVSDDEFMESKEDTGRQSSSQKVKKNYNDCLSEDSQDEGVKNEKIDADRRDINSPFNISIKNFETAEETVVIDRFGRVSVEDKDMLVEVILPHSPYDFWCQDLKQLIKITKLIPEDPQSISHIPKEHEVYLGYVDDYDEWYRVEVLQVFDEEVEVNIFDYQDIRTIPLANLSPLPSSLLSFPILAFNCSLEGFEMPDKDSQTDLVNTKFSSLVRDQKMWVKGKKERSLCHVKLISYEGLDIKNELEKYSSTL